MHILEKILFDRKDLLVSCQQPIETLLELFRPTGQDYIIF